MTTNRALYALAIAVLMGSMAVAALADDQGMNAYGPADSSVSAQTEQSVDQTSAGEIREPVETGALPDRSMKDESVVWPDHFNPPGIDAGGGGE